MQQARDEDGNIWDVSAPNNPVLVQAAQSQGIQTQSANPGYQYEGQIASNKAAASEYDDDLARDRLASSAEDRRLAREKFEFDKRQAALEQSKSSSPMTAVQRAEAIKGYQDAIALDTKIANLEKLYQKGPGSTGLAAGIVDHLPLQQNKDFDAASNAMRGTIKGVLGFTGGEVNSAAEAEFNLGPYIPSAGNYDSTIEGTIERLKDEAETAKAKSIAILGGIPDQYGNVTRPEKQESAASQKPESQIRDTTQQQMVGGSQVQVAPAKDGFETVDDPALAGVNDEVYNMLASGSSAAEIGGYLESKGVNPIPMMGAIQKNVEIQKTNPGIRPTIDVDDMQRAISPERQVISNLANTDDGAFLASVANMATAGQLDELGGEGTQQSKEYLRQQYPGASFAGDVTGGLAMMLPIGRGIQAGAKGLGAMAGTGKVGTALTNTGNSAVKAGLVGDIGFGAALGAGENNNDRMMGAATGAVAAGVGNKAGSMITGGLGRGLRGVQDKAVQKLNAAGVPMTSGQILGQGGAIGRAIKAMEDGLESVPLLGSAIRNRREDGMRAFNKAAFDEALQPIGKTTQDVGEGGIEQALKATSEGYGEALDGVTIAADDQFAAEVAKANTLGSTVPDFGPQFTNIMENKVAPIAQGADTIDGRQFQQLRRATEGYGRKYDKVANGQTPQPMAEDVSEAFKGVTAALDGTVQRNAPDVFPKYQAANKAHGNVQTLKDAVGRSRNGTRSGETGIFAPSQLNDAAESAAKKFGGRNATTQRPFYDLAKAGQEVLPSNMANSGTVDRALATAALPAALGGAGYATGVIEPETAALIAGAGLPFTKTGQKTIQKMLLSRPQALQSAGDLVMRNRRLGGLIGAPAALSLIPR